ncbi:MAG TPA: hypothetical protein VEI03_01635 [Stellaceae bacterium]|nr:hypothetical protein [Stellaceae bacterium]
MKTLSLIAGALCALLAVPALAQMPGNIRGKVESLDGRKLMLKSREGQELQITLAPDFAVLGILKAKRADIKQGDFIGIAAAPGKDGKLHAQEVLIFPEAARGTGEGHYAWDLRGKDDTMTNGTVSGIVNQSRSRALTLAYKGGEQEILISSRTPVVTFKPADLSLLKPGATIFIPRPTRQPDGTIIAARAVAEQNGVKPPM